MKKSTMNGADTMKCPSCQHNGTRVVDSRPADEDRSIRRRRECEKCSYRFTTFERVEEKPLIIVKKEGTIEQINHEKIFRELIHACEKRPVDLDQLAKITHDIERELRNLGQAEINSGLVGELVMDK